MCGLGFIAAELGNADTAVDLLMEFLPLWEERSNELGRAACLLGLSIVSIYLKDGPTAARALGAIEAWLERTTGTLEPPDRLSFARGAEALRSSLGNEEFGQQWAIGRELSLDSAILELKAATAANAVPTELLMEMQATDPAAGIRIEIDQGHQSLQVASIVETEFFQALRREARHLREANSD